MDTTPNDLSASDGSWLFLRAIRRALARPVAWFGMALALFLLAVPIGAPRYAWFQSVTANRYAPGSEVAELSTDFRIDHGAALESLDSQAADSLAYLAFLSLLLGIFAAGGWLQLALDRTRGEDLPRLLYGGARHFWRFLRVALLLLALLAGLRYLLFDDPWDRLVLGRWMEVPEHDHGDLETLGSELTVRRLGWLQAGLHALGFAFLMAWAIYTRTRLAVHDTRSALWAGWCSFLVILRHPIRTLRPLFLLLLCEGLVVTGLLGWITGLLDAGLSDDPTTLSVVGLFCAALAALIWYEVVRGAQYHAAVAVTRQVVRPRLQEDPWHSIGGPGGPQYPVDDDDERYGVSL